MDEAVKGEGDCNKKRAQITIKSFFCRFQTFITSQESLADI